MRSKDRPLKSLTSSQSCFQHHAGQLGCGCEGREAVRCLHVVNIVSSLINGAESAVSRSECFQGDISSKPNRDVRLICHGHEHSNLVQHILLSSTNYHRRQSSRTSRCNRLPNSRCDISLPRQCTVQSRRPRVRVRGIQFHKTPNLSSQTLMAFITLCRL